jgi:hypothetical protein
LNTSWHVVVHGEDALERGSRALRQGHSLCSALQCRALV